ncbi:protein MAK16 homolog isoform X1 [Brassica napus]|uniref:protein MAK16 homolog isoform X1 n=1 Tax=Brassica napus TaxID=3708 RepID=UPI002078EE21|nr:protein MAK16 homolog isoform X1 [Brassica napus]
MQNDEVIWQAIRHNHCSYMAKYVSFLLSLLLSERFALMSFCCNFTFCRIETGIFCRNPYNVTGICNRSSCPLANSRYATIRDHDGVFYLYMKTIERAHMPKNLWERIKLPRNYEKALELIDKHLLYWPKLLQHKVKQRLTKMTQIRIRTRKLNLKTREKIMTMARRDIKREPRREEKALKAAQLEKSIETELLERLMKGVYPKILDYPELVQKEVEVQEEEEEEEEEEPEIEYVEGYDELLEEEDIEDFYGGFPSKESHLDGDDFEDDEDGEEQVVIHKKGRALKKFDGNGKSKKKSKVVVEVEQDDGDTRQSLKSLML